MISEHVVDLAIEYLDQCVAGGKTATLVGMHWHIDGRDKTLPLIDEVNEALKRRPNISVSRKNASVIFASDGSEHVVTGEDMKQADTQYRKEFPIALAGLRK